MIKIKRILTACTCMMVLCFVISSCKSDDIASGIFEIAPKDLVVDVDKESTTVYVPISSSLTINDWEVDYSESWITHGKKRESLVLSFEANPNKEKRTAAIKVTSPVAEYTLSVNQYGEIDVENVEEGDTKVIPQSGTGSEPAGPNNNIDNTWDGFTFGRPYMTYECPATLEYIFTGSKVIDYIHYYPTSSGYFGKFKLFIATAESPEYALQGDYDFEMSGERSTINFTSGIKATKIKFEVEEGSRGMVGCAEMEFYSKTVSLREQLLSVFKDITCTELKPDIDDNAIETLPAEYFKRIAYALRDGRYNEWEKEFRVQEYKAYSNNEDWAFKLRIKKYSNLNNPTGISVNAGDEMIVLVGDTHGQQISLQCIGEEETDYYADSKYWQPAGSGKYYSLKPGINKLKIEAPGQLFLMYHTDITQTNALPIKIHIPLGSGKVTGFFDLRTHKTDEKYAELLRKATHKYICIKGEKIMFYFHTRRLREVVQRKILPTLEFWDNMLKWEQELAGIDVPYTEMNNHLLAISPEAGTMWSGDGRIAFPMGNFERILVPEKALSARDNVWGPAHEMGHTHQGAINWASCGESSNNLFSNYILYKHGKFCSRGKEISALAESYAEKKPWVILGDSKAYQNEDPEIHMRMFWQLWNYFHRLGVMSDFYPKLFKELRVNTLNNNLPGTAQFQFAKAVCKVANMDMTEFFDRWGFFREIDIAYEQYGSKKYTVNKDMIDEAKEYMAGFSKKCPPIGYLEDRKNGDVGIGDYKVGDVGHYSQFKDNLKISGTPTYKLTGNSISISNGEQAVAFEVRKGGENGELLYFFNFLNCTISPAYTSDGTKFYAVQADGKRIEMKKE